MPRSRDTQKHAQGMHVVCVSWVDSTDTRIIVSLMCAHKSFTENYNHKIIINIISSDEMEINRTGFTRQV